MSIKGKISILVATGSLALVFLVVLGWFTCQSLLVSMETIVNDQFIPLVQDEISPLIEEDILPVLNEEVHDIQEMNRSIKLMLDADRDIYQCLVAERVYISSSDKEAQRAARLEHDENAEQIIERIELAKSGLKGLEAKDLLAEAQQNYSAWLTSSRKVFELYDDPTTRELAVQSSLSGSAASSFNSFRTKLDEAKERHELDINAEVTRLTAKKEKIDERESLVAKSRDQVISSAAEMRTTAQRAIWTFLVIGSIAIFATPLLAYLLSLSILRPIRNLLSISRQVVAGDLDNLEFETSNSKDELGALTAAFGDVVATLKCLNEQTERLVNAAKQGDLKQRGSCDEFQGAYRELIRGLNEAVEAFAVPAESAQSAMEQVSKGKLTSRMAGRFSGVFADLQSSINKATEALGRSLNLVAATGSAVAQASEDMQQGSRQLAAKATQQASALEEVAASLEEMTSMTKQTASNAVQAKALSDETRVAAHRGNQAMRELGEAIKRIKSSADEQAKIVRTIDEIAFQTNLLALNAAVEAARAGESGRGFAVVAQEVRNLAQRTAHANQTTSEMIAAACESAEQGVNINLQMSNALEEISNSVDKTNDLMAEIAAAAGEQAQGIDQINTAVSEIDNGTQEAATNSQRSLQIADRLNQHVCELKATVKRFELPTSGVDQDSDLSEELSELVSSVSQATESRNSGDSALAAFVRNANA